VSLSKTYAVPKAVFGENCKWLPRGSPGAPTPPAGTLQSALLISLPLDLPG